MKSRVVVLLLFLVGCASGFADDVFYFRKDNGVAHDSGPLPSDFASDAQLRWKTQILPGHSSPCVCGDLVVLTTYDSEKKELATIALDRASGKEKWKRSVPTKTMEPVHATGSPATPTPASNGRQIFSFFGSYGMICYDMRGELVWERKLGPFQDEFGAASSPILLDGKVILNEDHDIDSFLIALDQASGEVVWKTPRPDATRSYSTPFILDRDGKKEILVAGSLQLAAYDPKNGQKLWWFNGLSRIVDNTPVVVDGVIYIATWTPGGDPGERISMEPFQDAIDKFDANKNGTIERDELAKDSPVLDRFFRIDLNQDQRLDESEWKRHAVVFEKAQNVAVALEPGTTGNLAPQYVRWSYARGLPTVPSSVVYDGVMTMVKDSGIVTVLNSRNGQVLQQLRAVGRGNYFSSLVAGDGKVYLTSESGVMTILKSGSEPSIVSSYDFGERIMATPTISRGDFFIRTDEALYCYRKKPSGN